ncbi:hypothetical protein LCGC14_1962490 [marine sediment metagenome]|uniref:Uncharacterized protein n=1 Tax=marine sediment metagenome TaxID=412755 RepID=A0A0F9FE31_9ZZZZ
MGIISRIRKRFARKTTTTTNETTTPTYAGGIEAHRTPSGYVPPPTTTTQPLSDVKTVSKPPVVKVSTPSRDVAIQFRKRLLKPRPLQIRPTRLISKGIDVLGKSALEVSLRLAKMREDLWEQKQKLIKEKGIKAQFSREGKRIDKELERIAVAETVVPFALLPSALKFFVNNPKEIKNIPAGTWKALKKEVKETGRLMLVSPSAGFVKIGAEVFAFKGTGKVLSLTGKVTGKTATRLSPKFSKIKGQKINIPSRQPGKVLTLKIAKPLKKGELIPLKEQVKLAGKKTTVVSAQADRLVNLIKTKRIVRKPIPDEKQLKPFTKKLLQKFDKILLKEI